MAAPKKAEAPGPRMESFEVERPDGVRVLVTRNIETGEQTVEALT